MAPFTSKSGFDLLNTLRNIIKKWQSENNFNDIQQHKMILIIAFSKD